MANKSYINKYAKALFDTSEKNNSTIEISDELNFISKIIKSIPEFNYILFTKNTSKTNKKNILSNVLNNKINPLIVELLLILMDNDDIQSLDDIISRYNYLMDIDSKELDVIITSNTEFSPDRLDSMKQDLSRKLNKQINIKTHVNENILGGIQLRIGNTIIDNSLSNKLEKLKNNLKNNQMNME